MKTLTPKFALEFLPKYYIPLEQFYDRLRQLQPNLKKHRFYSFVKGWHRQHKIELERGSIRRTNPFPEMEKWGCNMLFTPDIHFGESEKKRMMWLWDKGYATEHTAIILAGEIRKKFPNMRLTLTMVEMVMCRFMPSYREFDRKKADALYIERKLLIRQLETHIKEICLRNPRNALKAIPTPILPPEPPPMPIPEPIPPPEPPEAQEPPPAGEVIKLIPAAKAENLVKLINESIPQPAPVVLEEVRKKSSQPLRCRVFVKDEHGDIVRCKHLALPIAKVCYSHSDLAERRKTKDA